MRTTWLVQHLVTFLFFYVAVWFFYRLVSERLSSWRMGLLGALLLVLSPRVFADSFFNPKDLPLMSMTVICLYTFTRYFDRPSLGRAAAHALACALLIDIRIVGLLAPALTAAFALADVMRRRRSRMAPGRALASHGVYLLLVCLFTVAFWPALWSSPIHNFIASFAVMSRYPGPTWVSTALYLGRMVPVTQLPWHYVPVWMAITIPPVYTLLFLVGSWVTVVKVTTAFRRERFTAAHGELVYPSLAERVGSSLNRLWDLRVWILSLLWVMVPIANVISRRSVLYDGWRQLFFVYPAFLVLALAGLRSLWDAFAQRSQVTRRTGRTLLVGLLAVEVLLVAAFMVRFHPHENVYFNFLAGRDMSVVRARFDMDYWGLSYRQLIEHILRTDSSSVVRIGLPQDHGLDNIVLLSGRQAGRLVYDPSAGTRHYFLSEYRGHPEDYSFAHEFYAIRVNGGKIAVAYYLSEDEVDSLSVSRDEALRRHRGYARAGLL